MFSIHFFYISFVIFFICKINLYFAQIIIFHFCKCMFYLLYFFFCFHFSHLLCHFYCFILIVVYIISLCYPFYSFCNICFHEVHVFRIFVARTRSLGGEPLARPTSKDSGKNYKYMYFVLLLYSISIIL